MWNIFGKKKKEELKSSGAETALPDWSFLKTDIHSHLLPGIDDGAQTLEDSIALIEFLKEIGFTSLVTTPHIKQDHFPNTRESIENGLEIVRTELKLRGIDMPLTAAAEYYLDDHFMKLLNLNDLLPVTENQVLVELSFMYEPIRFYDLLFKIQTKGFRPILAHPERYSFYHGNIQAYKDIKARGCMLQLNTIALTGYYGKSVKNVANQLLKEGLYDYCGSDMHHLRHAEALMKITDTSLLDELRKYPFRNAAVRI